jgi:nicotinamide mononucleotide transporter
MSASLSGLAEHLAWVDPWLLPLNASWALPISRLEALASLMALAMVGFNLRVNPLGWPLAIASSALYALLFARSRLYGEATLQLVFIVLSVWGWGQWLRGRDAHGQALQVRQLSPVSRWRLLGVTMALWLAIGALLDAWTDSDVPYGDALPTAGSLVGQWLLARKWIDNWPCWLAVNVLSMALFAHKGLWLTVALYGVFAVLSGVGWAAWARRVGVERWRGLP